MDPELQLSISLQNSNAQLLNHMVSKYNNFTTIHVVSIKMRINSIFGHKTGYPRIFCSLEVQLLVKGGEYLNQYFVKLLSVTIASAYNQFSSKCLSQAL